MQANRDNEVLVCLDETSKQQVETGLGRPQRRALMIMNTTQRGEQPFHAVRKRSVRRVEVDGRRLGLAEVVR